MGAAARGLGFTAEAAVSNSPTASGTRSVMGWAKMLWTAIDGPDYLVWARRVRPDGVG